MMGLDLWSVSTLTTELTWIFSWKTDYFTLWGKEKKHWAVSGLGLYKQYVGFQLKL